MNTAISTRAPVAPPRQWFANPKLTGPTPLTVTPEGHVFGHLATWDSCHLASADINGSSCVRAPKSRSDYAGFHLGYVTTAEGEDVATGRIVAGAPHADPVWSLDPTLLHYSHSGWVGADVRAGEDRYGIWIAGAVRPDVTPEQLRSLKASPLSGDWRTDPRTGQLELVAALAVNSPGFAIPRPRALIASLGGVRSLQSVGMVQRGVAASDPRDVLALRALRMRANFASAGRPVTSGQRTVGDARRLMARLAAERPAAIVASLSAPGANTIPWRGVLGLEGVPTGDGRLIDAGALSAARYPMPLRWAPIDMGGHDGAVIVGTIDNVARGKDGQITASGVLDLGSPDGQEAARMIAGGFLSGVSFDLDSVDNQTMFSPTGPVANDEDGPSPDMVVQAGRIRGATLVAIPAFDEARIELAAPLNSAPDSGDDCGCTDDLDTVTDDSDPAPMSTPSKLPPAAPLTKPAKPDDLKTLSARIRVLEQKVASR